MYDISRMTSHRRRRQTPLDYYCNPGMERNSPTASTHTFELVTDCWPADDEGEEGSISTDSLNSGYHPRAYISLQSSTPSISLQSTSTPSIVDGLYSTRESSEERSTRLEMWNEAWREATTTDRPPPPIYGHHTANPALHRRQSMDMMTPRRGQMKAHIVAPLPVLRPLKEEEDMSLKGHRPSSHCCCRLISLPCACYLLAIVELIYIAIHFADTFYLLVSSSEGGSPLYYVLVLGLLLMAVCSVVGLIVGVARRRGDTLIIVHLVMQTLCILAVLSAAVVLIVSVAMGGEVLIRVVNTSPTMAMRYNMPPSTEGIGSAQPRVAGAAIGGGAFLGGNVDVPRILQARSPSEVFSSSALHSVQPSTFVSPALRLLTLAIALFLLILDVLLIWAFTLVFRCYRHIRYVRNLSMSTQSSSLDEQSNSPPTLKR